MSEKKKRGRPINEELRDELEKLCGKGPLALSRMTGNNLLSEERVKKALEKHPELYEFYFQTKKKKTYVYAMGRLPKEHQILECAEFLKPLIQQKFKTHDKIIRAIRETKEELQKIKQKKS